MRVQDCESKMREFYVTYKTVGLRQVVVQIPHTMQLPTDWETMTNEQKDEWLYEVQTSSRTENEDVYTAVPVNIKEAVRLELVK